MKRQIDLIRHAESLDNLQRDYIGGRHNSVELSSNGRLQARELGAAYQISSDVRLLSSTAIRATQTAEIAFPNNAYEVDDSFVEMSQGVHEGMLRSEIHTPEYFHELSVQGWNHRAPGGESLNEVADRMMDGVNEHSTQSHKLVIVTHITSIRALIGRIKGLSQGDTFTNHKVDPTKITRLVDNGRGLEVEFFNVDANEVTGHR